jgi:hypothetical protein
MRYLRIFIFFQIKKPFEICQPSIQVKKAKFHSKKKKPQPTPPPPPPQGYQDIDWG